MNPEVERRFLVGEEAGRTVAGVKFPDQKAARAFAVPESFGPEVTYDPRCGSGAGIGVTISGWSFGAVPYRRGSVGWEVVVVTTRRRDRWIFPKGQPEPRLDPGEVALMECLEEAGVKGKITGHPILVPYERESGVSNLLLFPVLVTGLADKWREAGQRDRRVLGLDAAEKLDPAGLVALGVRWLRDLILL